MEGELISEQARNFRFWVHVLGKGQATQRTTLGTRQEKTTNTTHTWHQARIKPVPHWCEGSVLTTVSCLLPASYSPPTVQKVQCLILTGGSSLTPLLSIQSSFRLTKHPTTVGCKKIRYLKTQKFSRHLFIVWYLKKISKLGV